MSDSEVDALSYNRCRFATRPPTDGIYTRSHYWLREVEPGLWRVGLTAYGTRLLGEIVEYEFKVRPGTAVEAGQTIGWVEGFKTLSDLVGGKAMGGEVAYPSKGQYILVGVETFAPACALVQELGEDGCVPSER